MVRAPCNSRASMTTDARFVLGSSGFGRRPQKYARVTKAVFRRTRGACTRTCNLLGCPEGVYKYWVYVSERSQSSGRIKYEDI